MAKLRAVYWVEHNPERGRRAWSVYRYVNDTRVWTAAFESETLARGYVALRQRVDISHH